MSQPVDLRTRLDFIRFSDSDRQNLAKAYEFIRPALPAILDGFYEHLQRQPALAAKIGVQAARLKAAQATHWDELFSGRFDASYAESVRRIGETHVRIDLDVSWYVGGYSFVMEEIEKLIAGKVRFNVKAALAMMGAVRKAVLLDMDMAISVYPETTRQQEARKRQSLEALLASFDGEVRGGLSGLISASGRLRQSGQSLEGTANETSRATESATSSAQHARHSVDSCAAATEELTASIGEIGHQANKSLAISRRAVEDTERTNRSVQGLAEAAEKIGSVVGLISEIAAQTNLLALNATIEAARAGEAGRGFAVVASEVKSLAGQTAKATDEISQQIAAIQEATHKSVTDIRAIATTIDEVASIASAIAAAVEEQGAATQEIAANVVNAAERTADMARGVNEVTQATSTTQAVAAEVLEASAAMDAASRHLDGQVSQFLDKLRFA